MLVRGEALTAEAGYGIKVRLIKYTEDGERLIAASARLSLSRKPLDSLLSMPDEEVETWIRETLVRGHFSPWEHSSYTWIVEGCTRVCSHQLVRHRIASYTQQSMRYTEGVLRDAALKAAGILGLECPLKPGKTQVSMRRAFRCYYEALSRGALELTGEELYDLMWGAFLIPYRRGSEEASAAALQATASAALYYKLLSNGISKEDARFVLPLMVRTRIIVTMNARELIQSFLPLRLCTRAQWEIRRVAWALLSVLNSVHPRLFRYAGPRCVLQENLQRGRPATLKELIEGEEEFTINYCPERIPRRGIRGCLLSAFRTLERR
ncbi:MAG: FAD-dependent thymidylate synthase [Desulfurococcales archaeon]|nr:FAD-dependent thymidylate synthase [Desulfurococcales archaeon]